MTVESKLVAGAVEKDPAVLDPSQSPGGLGNRHLQVLLLFFGSIFGYGLRAAMSVAVVAMADSSTANENFEDYDWDEKAKSLILSSFFWGYATFQLPAGYIAHHWSAKNLLGIGMLVCGLINTLIPIAARYGGWGTVCALRVIMGLTQGCLLPTQQTLLSKWVPPLERSRLGTFIYAGGQLGTVLALVISGSLAASSLGWPSIFYVIGAGTIIWAIAFLVLGGDSPATHRAVSDEEKDFINASFGDTMLYENKPKTPWKHLFTSVPFWSLILVHCGQSWGFFMLLTEMPAYMSAVLQFDIKKNGLTSSIPYLTNWLLSFPISWLVDFAIIKGVNRGVARKASNTLGHWGPAVALIGLCYVPSGSTTLAVVLLSLAVGLNAAAISGFQVNHIDLSPNYAGTMMSITNCFSAITGIVGPLITGMIVTNNADAMQWSIVFYLTAGIYFLGDLIFIVFGKGEVQWWNDTEKAKKRQPTA